MIRGGYGLAKAIFIVKQSRSLKWDLRRMAIKPICDSCKEELDEFGAILSGPPENGNNVRKFHICRDCYQKILSQFNESA